MDIRSLQVTAALAPSEGAATILKRLARVAGFYALAAIIGATAVLLVAVGLRLAEYLPILPASGATLEWVLLAIWGVLTLVLISLWIYRRLRTSQEDDWLTAFVRNLEFASGTLAVVLVCVYIYFRNVI